MAIIGDKRLSFWKAWYICGIFFFVTIFLLCALMVLNLLAFWQVLIIEILYGASWVGSGIYVDSRKPKLKRLPPEPEIVAWRAKHAQKLKPCSQPEQDIGKFMKHGKLLPHYRKSVKAKVPAQESDEEA